MQTKDYGKKSEIIASKYLIDKGYKILARNYVNKIGEIDIIAKDGDYIVFVEVKARLSRAYGDPLEAIDERKQMKVRQVATAYLRHENKLVCPCRFDAISILGNENPEIDHIVDAF